MQLLVTVLIPQDPLNSTLRPTTIGKALINTGTKKLQGRESRIE